MSLDADDVSGKYLAALRADDGDVDAAPPRYYVLWLPDGGDPVAKGCSTKERCRKAFNQYEGEDGFLFVLVGKLLKYTEGPSRRLFLGDGRYLALSDGSEGILPEDADWETQDDFYVGPPELRPVRPPAKKEA
jgi:hypothetical protein